MTGRTPPVPPNRNNEANLDPHQKSRLDKIEKISAVDEDELKRSPFRMLMEQELDPSPALGRPSPFELFTSPRPSMQSDATNSLEAAAPPPPPTATSPLLYTPAPYSVDEPSSYSTSYPSTTPNVSSSAPAPLPESTAFWVSSDEPPDTLTSGPLFEPSSFSQTPPSYTPTEEQPESEESEEETEPEPIAEEEPSMPITPQQWELWKKGGDKLPSGAPVKVEAEVVVTKAAKSEQAAETAKPLESDKAVAPSSAAVAQTAQPGKQQKGLKTKEAAEEAPAAAPQEKESAKSGAPETKSATKVQSTGTAAQKSSTPTAAAPTEETAPAAQAEGAPAAPSTPQMSQATPKEQLSSKGPAAIASPTASSSSTPSAPAAGQPTAAAAPTTGSSAPSTPAANRPAAINPAQSTPKKEEKLAKNEGANARRDAGGVMPFLPASKSEKGSSQGDQQQQQGDRNAPLKEAQIVAPTMTPFPAEIAPVAQAAATQAAPFLSPETLSLYYQMSGTITAMVKPNGDSHTEFLINSPAFANSKFYGATVTIDKFSTAPHQINIRLSGSTEAVTAFNQNIPSLMNAFQEGKHSFTINRIDAVHEKPMFQRKGKTQDKGSA